MNRPKTEHAIGKILVADDDLINRQLLLYQLAELKCNLIFAKDGHEALDLFKKNRDVLLVLMDVRMPGMDGIEATREILKVDPSAKIIALSAFSREDNSFNQAEVGFVDYVSKPILKETLLETLLKHL